MKRGRFSNYLNGEVSTYNSKMMSMIYNHNFRYEFNF